MAASIMLNIRTNQLSHLILRKQPPKKSSSLTQTMRIKIMGTNHNPRLPKITIKTTDITNMITIITINMIIINLLNLFTTTTLKRPSNSQLQDKLFQKIKFLLLFKKNNP